MNYQPFLAYQIITELTIFTLLIIAFFVVWALSRPKPERKGKGITLLLEKYEKQGAKSLGDVLLLEQQRAIKAVETIEKDAEVWRDKTGKIKKFHFSNRQLLKFEESPKKEKDKTPLEKNESAIENIEKIENQITISFPLLQEFDIILPSIQGVYSDFSKAVLKFKKVLNMFLTLEEQNHLKQLMDQGDYKGLVATIQEKATAKQDRLEVSMLLQGKFFEWLQYGNLLETSKNRTLIINYPNIQLLTEIYNLLQQLFLKYSNDEHKTNYKSFSELLDNLDWEKLENLEFKKGMEDFGQDIQNILVEDFLVSLNPTKRAATKYRSFRLVLRDTNSKDASSAGELAAVVVKSIREIYKKIKENSGLQTQDDIVKLVNEASLFKEESIQISKNIDYEKQEERLRNTVSSIVKFLGWYPQNEKGISSEEKSALHYFDRLMYSRKSRFSIVRDIDKVEDGKVYQGYVDIVSTQMKKAHELLGSYEAQHGDIVGTEIKIATPRQGEDYFPLKGVISDVITETTDIGDIIKFEVLERRSVRSFVIYTGNNITFC